MQKGIYPREEKTIIYFLENSYLQTIRFLIKDMPIQKGKVYEFKYS